MSQSRAPSPVSRPRSPLPPTLRRAPSFASVRAQAAAAAATATATASTQRLTVPAHVHVHPAQDADSAASSVVGVSVDVAEGGFLMKEGSEAEAEEVEAEAEAETEGETPTIARGHFEGPAGDDEARRALRAQLRRTLTQTREPSTHGAPAPAPQLSPKAQGKQPMSAAEPDVHAAAAAAPPRQYFVLTDAGKPVFVSASSALAADHDARASTMGLIQALISVFLDDGDKLRCINAGRMRITFVLRSPLYLVCVSSWGEPESVTRSHLEYLHLQILSVVSGAQLRRIFERRTNFDLRRLLSGAETFLHTLLARMQTDLAMSTSALLCLALDPGLRRKAGDALVPTKMKDILYVMLIARGRVVTLVRPKKHSVHPADLHILLNTVNAPAITNSPASWLPICLPKFNASGFLHAYVAFPHQGGLAESSALAATAGPATSSLQTPNAPELVSSAEAGGETAAAAAAEPTGLGLVVVSGGGGGDFEAIRAWCEGVITNLESSGTLAAIARAVRQGRTAYPASALGVPGLRHFVYKSRAHVQVTHPEWGDEYADAEARRRLITLYQTLYDNIHGKSGQTELLKLQYIRTARESVMGWITQPFELYVSVLPSMPKAAVVSAANAVMRWVKKEEARLFLRDAPVF